MQLVLLITVVIGIIRMRHRAWLYALAAALFCGAYMTVNSQQSYLGVIMLMLIIPGFFLALRPATQQLITSVIDPDNVF